MKSKIIEIAIAEIGTCEEPKDSNLTKYGKWFGRDGLRWCAIFVSWVYYHAGYPLSKKLGWTKGMAGCQIGYNYFKENGMITTEPEPGDIVFYDFTSDGRMDHVGIFKEWTDNKKTFVAIEGNTSLKNDSNGGMVMQRKRTRSNKTIFVKVVA